MEKLIEEFKRKMYLDGKSARTTEVYSNSVKEFFAGFMKAMGMWNLNNCTVKIFWNTRAI